MVWIRITFDYGSSKDPNTRDKDSSVPLMYYDPSDLESAFILIRIMSQLAGGRPLGYLQSISEELNSGGVGA